ncbi:YbaB/EbfC family nucleoid-associated protein [Sphaerisporangium sp. TRM90804]|uniref:YbaB/EbfC family nucleoid-associated protein n=1 Tax=Sphaerisporangium sp. TRM90804 TaxID=3031113 RepID=UPI00244CE52D|nr:YbaB/EbfC family nucleoid-associated protein [Sphaerisporangium sp. TRM90804]MDH2425067.1 YbaB/EbfC family nucleoid-associated protein [Sphaerisporangium sp. TRM90804]
MDALGRADAAEVQAYADELRAAFVRLREEAPALHEKARTLQVTERSRDGLVSATVGARGDLVRLDIDPRVYRRPDSRHLADAITETVQRAAATAQARVIEIFEPLIPEDQMRAHLEGDLDRVLDQMAARLREAG